MTDTDTPLGLLAEWAAALRFGGPGTPDPRTTVQVDTLRDLQARTRTVLEAGSAPAAPDAEVVPPDAGTVPDLQYRVYDGADGDVYWHEVNRHRPDRPTAVSGEGLRNRSRVVRDLKDRAAKMGAVVTDSQGVPL